MVKVKKKPHQHSRCALLNTPQRRARLPQNPHAGQHISHSPQPKNEPYSTEKELLARNLTNHPARQHTMGCTLTIPIIMTLVCSPPTLLSLTLLSLQNVRIILKLPSQNIRMT
jgi:hypothetical protein